VARVGGLGIVVVLVVVLVAALVFGNVLVRRPWPQTNGEIALDGLGAKVSVVRDARGIPHIEADNVTDLFRGQGFVTAQDRFFTMDLRRHVTAGRLAELVGTAGLASDRLIRTMGWRQVAEQSLPLLAPSTRAALNAYAEGVNDYLQRASDASDLGLEYPALETSLGAYRPEKWSATDSLAWLTAMAFDLKGNYAGELTRGRLAALLDPAMVASIYPSFESTAHAPILSGADWQPGNLYGHVSPGSVGPPAQPVASSTDSLPPGSAAALAEAQAALDGLSPLAGAGEGIGSNSWVLGPSHSASGKPLLANDPHLSTSMPGIWYQTSLRCRTVTPECPYDVTGFAFAGFPGVIVGHNAAIAWGVTNLAPDVTDFYLEKVDGDTYLRDGQQVPLSTSTEQIKVRGGEDVTLVVRKTGHGPILGDVVPAAAAVGAKPVVSGVVQNEGYAVSLAWTGLTPTTTADAVLGFDAATSFTDFRKAARSFAVPSQNLVYADVHGHIGYQAPGLIPIRRPSTAGYPPGYLPAPGWDSQWDWTGYVPFDSLPWAYDPPEGVIVAANQQVTATPTPFLTTEWDYGYRAARISDLLAQGGPLTAEQMSSIQTDTRNTFAPTLVKALLAIDLGGDTFTGEARDLLAGWDGSQPADDSEASAAAAYFNAVWSHLLADTFDDQLPDGMRADGGARWWAAVTKLLADSGNLWWDDKRTPGLVENRDEMLRRALVEARLDLTKRLGVNPQDWSWGKLHTLTLAHPVLGSASSSGLVRAVFNRGAIAMPGGGGIVDATSWDAAVGFDVVAAPSMRMVVDLGNLDSSTWVNQTGASGHAFDTHYSDQVDTWAAGGTYPWPFTTAAVTAARDDLLTLVPKAAAS
jgi:penicillin amidase